MSDKRAHLEDSLFDVDTHTLPIHTFTRFAHQAQLKVDANLLTRLLGELQSAQAPSPLLVSDEQRTGAMKRD